GVDPAQRAGEDLRLKLAADGEVRRLAKEILRKVRPARRQLGEIECRYLEHLARAFAVAGRDDRRLDIEKALLLKKVVNRLRNLIANTGDGPESVGARPQMGDGAQKLE